MSLAFNTLASPYLIYKIVQATLESPKEEKKDDDILGI